MNEFPISRIQEPYWVINKMQPGNPAYNFSSIFKIHGQLDSALLKKSVNEIIKRHEILRTEFKEIKNGAVHVIHKNIDFEIAEVDLRENNQISENEIDNIIREEIAAPFDLKNAPLLRIKLFKILNDKFYLSITLHHIITDLYSNNIFLKELSFFYNKFSNNENGEINKQKYHYSDYLKWEKEWGKTEEFRTMLSYWDVKLKGVDSCLNFPSDHSRTDMTSHNGSSWFFSISEPVISKIRNYSKKKSIDSSVILLSVYYVLLYRYTFQSSIVVGLPFTNRRNNMQREIMGCLMNILPIRIDNISDSKFDSLVNSVNATMCEAEENQELTFEEIVNHIKPVRNPGINPLYQVGFSFEPPKDINLKGLKITQVEMHPGGSQLNFSLSLWESGSEIKGRVEYNLELFEEVTICNLCENYTSMINELIDNHEDNVAKVSIKSDYLENTNGDKVHSVDENHFNSINQMIEEQVLRTPNKVAAVFYDSQLTYSELDQRANQLAHYLIYKGVKSNSIIGVYMRRSLDILVTLIAIHKAGAAYIPLDPEFPSMRIEYMIEHSGLCAIISHEELSGDISPLKVKIISYDSEQPDILKQSSSSLQCSLNEDSLAYLMYTSGSTGKPKGVQITHSNVINFLGSMRKTPGIDQDDILLAITTISFDISVLEMFLPLICGAKVVILSKEDSTVGKLLIESINEYKPTIIQATPVTWKILFSSGWSGSKKIKVLCGGEAMPRDIANKLVDSVRTVWNMYGPTETTVWSTCFQVENAEEPLYIGKPIDNTYVYILDSNMQHVPSGVMGEIYIGGKGVAKGYHNAEELTAERFIIDPFKKENHFIYKTGDVGRIAYNGLIEFFNRIDSQVQVRAFRIELSEIEYNMNQHEYIYDSAASVITDVAGNARIVGYVVPKEGREVTHEEIRFFLMERIPGYMLPDIFVYLEVLPITPNGKVNRKALPLPDFEKMKNERNIILPSGEVEKKLAQIWQEILLIDEIGIHDNYFDIGGTSLLSVEIVNRVNSEFNTNISLIMLFKYSTVASLAKYLLEGEKTETNSRAAIEERMKKRKNSFLRQKAMRSKNKS